MPLPGAQSGRGFEAKGANISGLHSIIDPRASELALETCVRALLPAIVRREQRAIGRLYDLCVDRVYGIALRVLQQAPDAEEVCCDVFHQIWEQAARYDPARGSVLAWIGNLAWSRSVDRLRRERGHRIRLQALPESGDLPMPAQDDPAGLLFDALQYRSRVRSALARLSPAQQRMVALAFLEDLSHPEIAARTGTPLGTVKSHIRRGLATLREVLGLERLAHE